MSVEELISDAQNYVSGAVSDAIDAINLARSEISAKEEDIDIVLSEAKEAVFGSFRGALSLPDAPEYLATPPGDLQSLELPVVTTRELILPAPIGNAPEYDTPKDVGTGGIPTSTDIKRPKYVPPTKPSALASFTSEAPSIRTNFGFPSAPSALVNPLIKKPVINDRPEPTAPTISMPSFDATRPTNKPGALVNLEGQTRSSYSGMAPSMITAINGYVDDLLTKYNPQYHTQMAAIETQIAKYMAGGTGLSTSVEEAIYSRARSKNDAEARRVRDSAYGEAANRGFTLPSGALMSSLQNGRQAAADNNASAAREIVVMQAEMEQRNLQFAVSTSLKLRETMVQATISYMSGLTAINGQALDYAKTVLQSVIEAYNASIKLFELDLEVYKAEAAVFDMQLRAVLTQVQIYQAEISALQALTQVDTARISMYKTEIESLMVYAAVYKSQIDVVQAEASLEKLKLDLYGSQVQLRMSEVQAKNAEWSSFNAEISGQTAEIQAYAAQMDGFKTEMLGWKSRIDADVSIEQAKVAVNEARAKQFAVEGQRFSVEMSAESAKTQALIESDRQGFAAFKAAVDLAVTKATQDLEIYKSEAGLNIAKAKLQIDTAMESTRAYGQLGDLYLRNQSELVRIYGTQVAGALSGMNSMASEIKYE